MKKFKVSVGAKILLCILSAAFVGLAVFVVFQIIGRPLSKVTFLLIAAVIVLFRLVGIFLQFAFRSYIEITESLFTYFDGMKGTKEVSFSEISSYFVDRYTLSVTYTSLGDGSEGKAKTISILRVYKDWRDLLPVFAEHGIISFEEKVQQQDLHELKYGEYANLSEEEQRKHLKKAELVSKIFNITALIAAVWYLFFPRPYDISTGVNVALPIIALLLLKISDGWIHFDEEKGSIYPSVLAGFLIPSAALVLGAIKRYDIYQFLPALYITLAVWIACVVLFFLCQKEFESYKKSKWIRICCICLIMISYGGGAAINVNCQYDYSEPQLYQAKIVDKDVHTGKNTTYYLTITPWIDGVKEKKDVSVSKEMYERAQMDEQVIVGLQKGLLKAPWYWVVFASEE